MNHYIKAEGFGVRLRPVRQDDAAFIVWLRNLDHVRGRIGDSASDVACQQKWLELYFNRADDFYFIVETLTGVPVGTYSLYNINGLRAESGRWIIRPEVPAALPSVFVLYDLAFCQLKFTELNGSTVATNQSVLSINRKLGWQQTRVESSARHIGGQTIDLIHFVLTPSAWAKARMRLLPLARLAECQMGKWESTQCDKWGASSLVSRQ